MSFVTEAQVVFIVHKEEFVLSRVALIISYTSSLLKIQLKSVSMRSPRIHVQSSITVELLLVISFSWLGLAKLQAALVRVLKLHQCLHLSIQHNM